MSEFGAHSVFDKCQFHMYAYVNPYNSVNHSLACCWDVPFISVYKRYILTYLSFCCYLVRILSFPRCGVINKKTKYRKRNLTNTVIIMTGITMWGYKYRQKHPQGSHRVNNETTKHFIIVSSCLTNCMDMYICFRKQHLESSWSVNIKYLITYMVSTTVYNKNIHLKHEEMFSQHSTLHERNTMIIH